MPEILKYERSDIDRLLFKETPVKRALIIAGIRRAYAGFRNAKLAMYLEVLAQTLHANEPGSDCCTPRH